MPKTNGNEPTQETQPRYEDGAEGPETEIPIPTREEVFRDLGKSAKPRKPLPDPKDDD